MFILDVDLLNNFMTKTINNLTVFVVSNQEQVQFTRVSIELVNHFVEAFKLFNGKSFVLKDLF